MSTMELEGRRTDTPPSVKRDLWSPRHWAISLASLLVASCGHFPGPGGTPQDAPAPRDAADDEPSDAPRECDTAELACTGATTMIVCNAQCWVLCNDMKIPDDAQRACKGWGGALGEINNTDDQACVTTIVVQAHLEGDARAWLGLHQKETAQVVDEDWSWNPSPGTSVTIKRWAVLQPDDGNDSPNDAGRFVENHNEQCMNVDTDGLWHDGPCTGEMHPFLCRRR